MKLYITSLFIISIFFPLSIVFGESVEKMTLYFPPTIFQSEYSGSYSITTPCPKTQASIFENIPLVAEILSFFIARSDADPETCQSFTSYSDKKNYTLSINRMMGAIIAQQLTKEITTTSDLNKSINETDFAKWSMSSTKKIKGITCNHDVSYDSSRRFSERFKEVQKCSNKAKDDMGVIMAL